MKTARGSDVWLRTGAFPTQRSPCRVRSPHTATKPRPRQQCELGSRTPPAPRRSSGKRKQTPRDAGPGTGGLSRGSAEVGVAAGAWGPAPRGSEGRGEAESQADLRDATLDPSRIPPLLQATRPRKGAGGPSWARSPPWDGHSEMTPLPRPLLPLQGGGQTGQAG